MADQKVTKGKNAAPRKQTAQKGSAGAKKSKTANGAGKKTAASGKTAEKKTGAGSKKAAETKRSDSVRAAEERLSDSMKEEIALAVTLLVAVLFFLSYINLCGAVGTWLNTFIFGLFGIFGYLFPFLLFFGVAFGISNRKNRIARRRLWGALAFFVCLAALVELLGTYDPELKWTGYFTASAETKSGGGIVGGTLVRLFCPLFDTVATAVILLILMAICLMLVTGKEFFSYIRNMVDGTMQNRRREEEEDFGWPEEEEEREAQDYAPQPPRVITFQKSGKTEGTGEAPVGANRPKEEPIRFVDALKARGKKGAASQGAETFAKPAMQEPAAQAFTAQEPSVPEPDPVEEVLPPQEITITGNYQKEPEPAANISFYEEELKRKFGGTEGNAANIERNFYDVNVSEDGSVVKENDVVLIYKELYGDDEPLIPPAATEKDVTEAEGSAKPETGGMSAEENPQPEEFVISADMIFANAGIDPAVRAFAKPGEAAKSPAAEPEELPEDAYRTEEEGTVFAAVPQTGDRTVPGFWSDMSVEQDGAGGAFAPAAIKLAAREPENLSAQETGNVADFTPQGTLADAGGNPSVRGFIGIKKNEDFPASLDPGAGDISGAGDAAESFSWQDAQPEAGTDVQDVRQGMMTDAQAAWQRTRMDAQQGRMMDARQGTRTEGQPEPKKAAPATLGAGAMAQSAQAQGGNLVLMPPPVPEKKYEFPPIDLLAKPVQGKGANERELKETAAKLQNTLQSFGVRVTVTNISCGPAVTQYELQPEQGVKVNQITKLSDDIKLNLAATDIRIEAPIPGKAAVGIEVPNKENTPVILRELLESEEFKKHKSRLAFAVGKNISGQIVVSDIAKMPHMLIAGATGSGKSVCINTIIMSILYKADPKDVKLIMVDPKVVELSVYNGIPHLLIPVVTDPKKASAALNWAVAEMTDRYQKFAALSVRDLNGYNEKVAGFEEPNPAFPRLPQIVIIVDELADLMMVASANEVEDAICRLAQMARAAGLHLIIATQRPSVNVITGVIKANVPSRVAFAVTSAVDSRTILDGVGAERLLGKGDMLFFPSGYPKPVRIQGAFVSDAEVSAVVDFLKEQAAGTGGYNEEVNKRIMTATAGGDGAASGSDGNDDYFAEAGKFIIEKQKASIGMLQRVYKIGFNRAARIMDQLTAAGVVGPEEGTKPRKILMTMAEFEEYLNETF